MWKSEALLTAIAQAAPAECITEARMVDITGHSARSVEYSCLILRRRGLLTRTAQGCHKLTDAGRTAIAEGHHVRSGPRGRHTGTRVIRGTLRERAWGAMRILRKFSLADLIMLIAEGRERDITSNVGKYVRALTRAGLLRQLPQREQGGALTSNGNVRWLLIQDVGPLAPVWRAERGTVYDPNAHAELPLADDVPRASRRRAGGQRARMEAA